ncbi:M48 family metallopeptidase [Thalassorhabdomicrobium marinisediminis]|uniref:Metal-dependent hydrolase n=1 Tax=Thalassorhabdomicrobium marinisediminis TaxID=2170577 RepID=A0A2T7FTH4_9RHOB|nr:SprT family zinc-dependent metalloprotease [Thalassorhabdomicrobium marinisediminis]PVA05442.1 metal-dependent hydrolase [Thalassorhabdomicrobium marinisediminis]
MNTETSQIGGIEVEIVHKAIKNLHIGCYPPEGRVRIAAPHGVSDEAIRVAVLTRMQWIKRKQTQFRKQERQAERRFVSGETHHLFGRALRLDVQRWDKKVHRILRQGSDRLAMKVPGDGTTEQMRRWMDAWLKARLRTYSAPRISFWANRLDRHPEKWGIRPMKTKWGSCDPEKRIIWLNSELAKKPERMIDYVILHELAHLISPNHDKRFIKILDDNMPKWRSIRDELNQYPLPAWEDPKALAR